MPNPGYSQMRFTHFKNYRKYGRAFVTTPGVIRGFY
jgi:hypothetical protein